VANYVRYGKLLERLRNKRTAAPQPFAGLPEFATGAQPEWIGKKALAAMGIRVPDGGLAKSADEAASMAKKVGFPVAMKAQAAALTHKTEAGGVLLNIADEAAARRAFETLAQNVARAEPGVKLDGALVEKMAPKGVELMIGGKRDAAWGPVLLVGLGGIWVEALGDVRLLAPDASEDQIIEELGRLRTAKLLKGFRGMPEVDVQAVAKAAAAVGRLMLTRPEVMEVDINPLVALPKGQGAIALDALIVKG
jgi:acyl-CoA synthetase (NDP forming)